MFESKLHKCTVKLYSIEYSAVKQTMKRIRNKLYT